MARRALLLPDLSRYYGFPAPGNQRSSSPAFHGFADAPRPRSPRLYGLPEPQQESSEGGSDGPVPDRQRLHQPEPASDGSSFAGFHPEEAEAAGKAAEERAQMRRSLPPTIDTVSTVTAPTSHVSSATPQRTSQQEEPSHRALLTQENKQVQLHGADLNNSAKYFLKKVNFKRWKNISASTYLYQLSIDVLRKSGVNALQFLLHLRAAVIHALNELKEVCAEQKGRLVQMSFVNELMSFHTG